MREGHCHNRVNEYYEIEPKVFQIMHDLQLAQMDITIKAFHDILYENCNSVENQSESEQKIFKAKRCQ